MRRCLSRLRALTAVSLLFSATAFAAGPPPKGTGQPEFRPSPPDFRDNPQPREDATPLGGPAVPLRTPTPPKPVPTPPRPTPAPTLLPQPTAPPAPRPTPKPVPVATPAPAVKAGGADNRPAPGQPVIPGVTYSDASETATPGSTQPAAALGPAPYELGSIKAVRVGKVLLDAAPMRVGNLDVLSPIVDQMGVLGATVTRAEPKNVPGGLNGPTEDKFFQINLPQGAPIVLTIGKSTAWIDNNEQTLRAAPLILQNQIWLPVFSIAPLLGAAARLDNNGVLNLTPTVQSVELFQVKDALALTIKTSAPLQPGDAQLNILKGPDRIYVDFPGFSMGFDANNSTIERVVAPGNGDVLRARAGMPSKFPDTTRITLDLKRAQLGQPAEMPDKTLYALVITSPNGPALTSAPDLSEPMGTVAKYDVNNPNALRGMTIVVDAGHGGYDTGARGARTNEKDHTLDMAKRLEAQLEARGATVLLTRNTDNFISLQGRVDFANSRRADLFVSVHINASVNPAAGGTETYFYTAQSTALAKEVHKQLTKATGRIDRGVRQARFFVIRKTWMPSILTESAYITNSAEEALLMDPKYREKIAAGIAQGVANFVAVYGRGGVSG